MNFLYDLVFDNSFVRWIRRELHTEKGRNKYKTMFGKALIFTVISVMAVKSFFF